MDFSLLAEGAGGYLPEGFKDLLNWFFGPITYSLNEALKVSENGLLCNDSDGALAAAGIAVPIVVGIVSGVPNARNSDRLSVDLKY